LPIVYNRHGGGGGRSTVIRLHYNTIIVERKVYDFVRE
jgi:hypothetical protein